MKKYLLVGLALIIILGSLILPKVLGGKDTKVKYKAVEVDEIPDKIMEMLPKYVMEERALTLKFRDEIYVIVTRGEKKSAGFFVDIDKILLEGDKKGEFDLIVHAEFIDPKPDEALEQHYDYPYIIVKTNLKDMPQEVHLDITYEE